MDEFFGIITEENCFLRSQPGEDREHNTSGIEDEIFSGWAVRLISGSTQNGWVKIQTHYGYEGYISEKAFRPVKREELLYRQDKTRFFRIGIRQADLLSEPRVQGLPLELLLKNAFVELLEKETEEGWSRIRTAAGREGYVHTRYLAVRGEDDGYLLEETEDRGYFQERFRSACMCEEELRRKVTESARAYLGTQYRWGGKSSQGLDCSGLAFMSYMENGVLIYRDADIVPGYPIHPVGREELKEGDLIFFPGHVAVYLGNDRYIHSTAYAKTPYVTINSLNPKDKDYREDLDKKVTACGSLFYEQTEKDICEKKKTALDYCEKELAEKLCSLPGKVSVIYKDLGESGEYFSCHGEEPHVAASVIKLFLMAAVFQKFEEGSLSPEDSVEVHRKDCMPSCGVLNYLQGERRVSVRDLVELMVIVSDNTAANLLFDLVGEEYLDSFIRERLGMKKTAFRRKMFDAEKAGQGIENTVTAQEVAELLEKIYRGELVSFKASCEMYEILKHQRLNGKIPFYLHTLKEAPVIAHKTGEDTGITHDVAIVEGDSPFLLCFLGSETDVPEYERLMGEAAMEIYGRRENK